jgi:hypothetical protein
MEVFVNISVHRDRGKPLQIHPDPATVSVGENVTWELYYDYYDGRGELSMDPLLWTVYFSDGSPFPGWKNRAVETKPEGNPEHKGTLDGGATSSEGDYKYGVRVQNSRTKEILCDDDPRLIVRPRSR